MERHEIEIFLTLAEELHFGRTAERTGVSQSRVSQTIAKLERRFGVRLFERTSRTVTITAVGKQLRDGIGPAYRRILDEADRAAAAGRGTSGLLRVGYSTAFTGHLLVRIADAFTEVCPNVQIEIQEVPFYAVFGPLRAGEVDLQITESPVEEEDLTVGPTLVSQPRSLLVSSAHPFASRESVSLEDLADAVLFAPVDRSPAYWVDYHYPHHTPSGRPIPCCGQVITTWEDALSLITANRGVSPVAAAGERYFSRSGLTFVPFSDAPPIEYLILWPTTRETELLRTFARSAKAFVDARGGPTRVLDSL
jgi:DNA-binding transcriptional LysR family regulator